MFWRKSLVWNWIIFLTCWEIKMLRLLAIVLNMLALYFNRTDVFVDIAIILSIVVILISFNYQRERHANN